MNAWLLLLHQTNSLLIIPQNSAKAWLRKKSFPTPLSGPLFCSYYTTGFPLNKAVSITLYYLLLLKEYTVLLTLSIPRPSINRQVLKKESDKWKYDCFQHNYKMDKIASIENHIHIPMHTSSSFSILLYYSYCLTQAFLSLYFRKET